MTNTNTSPEKILHTIDLLRSMTAARGATANEEDIACRKIGQLIVRYNLTVLAPGAEQQQTHQQQRQYQRRPYRSVQTVSFEDVEAIGETEKALFCVISGEELWVPRSQISSESEVNEKGNVGTLTVTAWWARQRGLI